MTSGATQFHIVSALQHDLKAKHIPYPPIACASGEGIFFYRAILTLLLEGIIHYDPETRSLSHSKNLIKH